MARRKLVPYLALMFALVLAAPALAQEQEPAAPTGLTGEWTLAVEGPQGLMAMTLKMTQTEKEIVGTLASEMGELEIAGEVDGAEVAFWASIESPDGGYFDISFVGTVEENKKIVGWMEAAGGEFSAEFTAHRVEKS